MGQDLGPLSVASSIALCRLCRHRGTLKFCRADQSAKLQTVMVYETRSAAGRYALVGRLCSMVILLAGTW